MGQEGIMNMRSGNTPKHRQLVVLALVVSLAAAAGCSGSSTKRHSSGSAGGGSGAGTTAQLQQTVENTTEDTALSPVSALVDNVVDAETGLLAPVTSQLDALTGEGAPLEPVGQLTGTLLGDDGETAPVISALNGALTDGEAGTGSVDDAQGLLAAVARSDSSLASLEMTSNVLLEPRTGMFSGITGPVDSITGEGGALEPVGDLTAQLIGDNGALTPVAAQVAGELAKSPLAPVFDGVGEGLHEANTTLIQLRLASLGRTGAVSDVQGTTDRLLGGTALEPGADLVDNVINPYGGLLGGVTTPVEGATSELGPLAPVGQAVDGLIGEQGAITPVVVQVNEVIRGISAESLAAGGGMSDLPATDALAGLQDLLGVLSSGDGSDLSAVLETLQGGGDLAGVLGGLGLDSNPQQLGSLTSVLNSLGADGLTALLGGLQNGGDLTSLLGGLGGDTALLGGLTDGGLLNGLPAGGSLGTAGDGTVTDVDGTVTTLVGGTALNPVGELVSGVINPVSGALEPVTGPVDGLTSPDGALAPVGDLTNALIGPQDGVLTPVVQQLNGALGGAGGANQGGLTGVPVLGGVLGQ